LQDMRIIKKAPPKKRYRLSFLRPKLKRFPEELEMKRYGGIDLHYGHR
jgi:hypothetical protein